MAVIGDFSRDGSQIAVQARNKFGDPVPDKIEWVPVTPLEAETYNVRKGGFRTLTNQDEVKTDADGNQVRWQSALGIDEYLVSENVPYLGQTIYSVLLLDPIDFLALSGIATLEPTKLDPVTGNVVSTGYQIGAINELAFLVSAAAYDAEGNVVTDPAIDNPWVELFIKISPDIRTWASVLFRPQQDYYSYDVTGEPLNLSVDTRYNAPNPPRDAAKGVIINQDVRYIRHFSYKRVGDYFDVRLRFWAGFSGENMTFVLGPASFAEGTVPKLEQIGTGANAVFEWNKKKELTGGRIVSRLLIAAEPGRDNTLETAQEAKEGDRRPVSSDALYGALNTINKFVVSVDNRITDVRNNIGLLEKTADALARHDTILTSWLAGLTNFNGAGIYADGASVPTAEDVAVIRAAGVSKIYVRDNTGALKELASYRGSSADDILAYDKASKFVSGLTVAAGGAVNQTELNTMRSDINALAKDISTLFLNTGKAVEEVADYVIPEPIWPASMLVPLPTGSLMVRKGEVQTVKTTIVNNNSFAGSYVIGQTFGVAERGKSVIARAAVKAADKTARIELAVQTFPDGGAVTQATLSYINDAWVATGGTVTLDDDFAVLSMPFTFRPTVNCQILGGISAGEVQLLAVYDAASAAYSKTTKAVRLTDVETGVKVDLPITIGNDVVANRDAIAANRARIAKIEGQFDALSTVTALGGMTRSTGLPFISAPDRAGSRADILAFTFRDNRVSTSGKMDYPARVTSVSIPISAFTTNTAPANWTKTTRTINGEVLNAFTQKFNLKDSPTGANAFYDCWISWKRSGTETQFWFESLHSFSPNLGEARDISITYVADATVVDPKLKPITDRLDALEAKPAPQPVDLTPYAKKADLAKKQGRTKLWSPAVADLSATMGQFLEDTAPAFAGSADIDAKTFTVVPSAAGVRAAKVSFTVPNLVAGQKYELVIEVGSGLNTGFTLAGPAATTQDVTNWKKYSQIITATGTTYAGSYEVMYGATVHGPAVYALPGLYVKDEALASYQVAEPTDVAAAEKRAIDVTNFLAQTVQGQGARISLLEALPAPTPTSLVGVVAYAGSENLDTMLARAHPAGGTFKAYLKSGDLRAIDLTLGSNHTGATLRQAIQLDVAGRIIRQRSGEMNALIGTGDAVTEGTYRLWLVGTDLIMLVLDGPLPATYRTEIILDSSASLTSEKYLQIPNVPAGTYLATFRLTLNLTAIGSRLWAVGVSVNDASVVHPTNTHAVVAITADAYTQNYPHVASGSAIITLPNASNTVEVKGQLYGTDAVTGETVQHGHLTLIKL